MLYWGIWFASGALAGFKDIKDEMIDDTYEKNKNYVTRETIVFCYWFVFILLGGFALAMSIIGDILSLIFAFRKKK